MERYGYVETSAMAATYGGGHIPSVVDEDNILENGMLVKLGKMVGDEIWSISTPTIEDEVVLIADPAINYDQSTKAANHEDKYFIAAGTPARSYTIAKVDRFAIADYMVKTLAGSGKPAVKDNYIVTDKNRKYEEVAATGFDMSKYGFVAQIVDTIIRSGITLYLLHVVKNEQVVKTATAGA